MERNAHQIAKALVDATAKQLARLSFRRLVALLLTLHELQDALYRRRDVSFVGKLWKVTADLGARRCHGRYRDTLGQYP